MKPPSGDAEAPTFLGVVILDARGDDIAGISWVSGHAAATCIHDPINKGCLPGWRIRGMSCIG